MRKSLPLLFVAIFLVAGTAFAKSSGQSTKSGTLVISGTLAVDTGDEDANGACSISSLSSTILDLGVEGCSATGPGTCYCWTLTNPKVGGSGLKGATVTDLFGTSFTSYNPATAPVVDDGPTPGCTPYVAVIVITDKSGDSTTANVMGVSCRHVIGVSNKNPKGTHDQDSQLGGWGIDSATVPTSGWGTFTGTIKHSKTNPKIEGATSFKLKGWITE
jgi:hypothetical protein